MSNDESVGLGLAHEVEIMLRKVGATRENFWIPISVNEDLARQVFELVNAKPSYNVIVDCYPFVNMVKGGNYDDVDSNITENHFPVKCKGKQEVNVVLFHFDTFVKCKIDDVIAEMDKQGYRPVAIEELLAFGKSYPDLQRDFPIVALDSVWQLPCGYRRYVPYLCGDDSGRYLRLNLFDGSWSASYRFAAVRK